MKLAKKIMLVALAIMALTLVMSISIFAEEATCEHDFVATETTPCYTNFACSLCGETKTEKTHTYDWNIVGCPKCGTLAERDVVDGNTTNVSTNLGYTIYYVSNWNEINSAYGSAQKGDVIRLTTYVSLGSTQWKVNKEITIDLGGQTLYGNQGWNNLQLYTCTAFVNGKFEHEGGVCAIKVWYVEKFEDLTVEVLKTHRTNVGGIVLQSGVSSTSLIQKLYIGSIKNVTITGAGLYNNGLEALSASSEIGAMENVKIYAQPEEGKGQAVSIRAKCGTIKNCEFYGNNIGIDFLQLNGEFKLENCIVYGGNIAVQIDAVSEDATFVAGSDSTFIAEKTLFDVNEYFKETNDLGILETTVAAVNNKLYSSMEDAFAALVDSTEDVTSFVLMANVELPSSIIVDKKVDFSFGGGTYVYVKDGYSQTITIDGYKITMSNDAEGNGAFLVNESGALTINGGGTLECVGTAIVTDGGKVVINGGTYTNNGAGNLFSVINEGALEINAGTFYAYDPTDYTTEGTCVSVVDGSYVVAKTHTWIDATCTAPKTCSACGATEGDALGHTWTDATCTAPQTCSVCSATEGDALGHTWTDATCVAPQTCSVCSATEGEALGEHIYDLANATLENNVISIACSYECGLVATVTVNGTTATAGFNMMAYQNVITVDTPDYGKLTVTSSDGTACYMMTNPRMPQQLVVDPIIVNADGFNTSYILIPSFNATASTAPAITITYEAIEPATVVVGDNTVDVSAGQTKVQFNATAGMYYFVATDADVFVLDEYGSTYADASTLFTFEKDQVVYLIIYPYAESVTLTITKHEHSYVESVVDVTCTTNGYTLHKCSCGDSYTTDEVETFGHSFTYGDDYVYVSSTCKEAGYESDVCSVCGETFKIDYEINTEYGHEWGDEIRNEADTGYVQTCTLCGATQETITKGTAQDPIVAGDGKNTVVVYDSYANGVIYQYTVSGYGKLVISFETEGSVIYAESLMAFMRGMWFQTSATEYTFVVDPDNLMGGVCYFAVAAGVDSFNLTFEESERPVFVVGDNAIDGTQSGTNVTISTPGDYILSAADGENNAAVSVIINGVIEAIDLPYSFTVAEGETWTFTVGTADWSAYDVINLVLTQENVHVHTEEIIPAVPATKTSSGKTSGVKCSECEEVLVAPEEVAYDTLKVGALTLTLGENINVVYKNVIGSGYTDVYVVFKLNTANGDLEYTVTDFEVDEKGRYCFTFEGVRLQFMADNIDATIYAKTASGLEAVSSYPTYSVKQYIVNQLGKSTDAKFKTMISDLLVLGDKAQIYANYKTDSLMTADVTNLTASTFDGISETEDIKGYIGEKSTVADWKTMTLLVGNATTIKYTVQVAESELDNVVIVLSLGTEGEAGYRREEFKASELKLADGYTDRYVIEFTNMNVSAYGKTVTGVILHNGEQIGREYYYSVNSYLYANQNVSHTATQDFLRAMYQYGASALAYVNN